VALALQDLRQIESNVVRLERNLARSGASRSERRMWRAELSDWEPKRAAAARAVADLSAPDRACIDDEGKDLGERLSVLWKQRETHQPWVSDHPEASRRLSHLTAEIDALNRSLKSDLSLSSEFEPRSIVRNSAHHPTFGVDRGR
jgi:hypothetical protein